jgi:eukaryotic-like serine/threonine-protein kinase
MTPDEGKHTPLDEQLLDHVMACDAFLHKSSAAQDRDAVDSPRSTEADERGRSRLMLLLTMLEAAETPREPRADAGRRNPDQNRPLLGRFEVIEEIGSGGFGFVVRARDLTLGREVALKMPLPERVLGVGDVHRFLREAQAAARLDHPNIIRIYDAGTIGPLGYYIASEYCAGPSLRRWLKAQNQPVPPRLAARWLADLADAVQHAHDRGILHRDIKPDNVILARGDALSAAIQRCEPSATISPGDDPVISGGSNPDHFVPRLTDFGLAKLVEEPVDDTKSGARMGTPHYMAPEQAAGRKSEVGPATDVYALGATLYEILTGRPPFHGETDMETLRLVLDTEPVALRALRPGLPRDLDTICQKSLRKDPSRRYASAAALADDLKRLLDGQPIVGRPVSSWERAWGWGRRRPAVTALLGLVMLLAGGLVGAAARSSAQLRWHNEQLKEEIARADQQAREAKKQSQIAEERRLEANSVHYAESLRLARRALDSRQIELAQDVLHDIQPGPDGVDPRGFAWHYLWRMAHREFSQLWGHDSTVLSSVVSLDGKTLATEDLRGTVMVWGLAPGMKLDKPRAILSTPRVVRGKMFLSPDGRLLARLDAAASRLEIDIFETTEGRAVGRLNLEAGEHFYALAFVPGGQRLAVSLTRQDGTWAIRTCEVAALPNEGHSWVVGKGGSLREFSPDGRFLAVHRDDGITLHDPWSGKVHVPLAGSRSLPLGRSSFSDDGRFLAVHVTGGHLPVWETDSGREVARFVSAGEIFRLVFSPRGSRLAILDSSGRVVILERATGQSHVLTPDLGGRKIVGHSLSFSPDETLLAVEIVTDSSRARPPEVWDVETAKRVHVSPGRNFTGGLTFLHGGRSLYVGARTATTRIWRLQPSGEADSLAGHAAEAWATAFSPDGKILATGSDDTKESQTIKLWDPATGRLLAGWKAHTATVATLAFSPDGSMLASGSLNSGKPENANVLLWDVATRKKIASLEGHTDRVRSVAFSPDGRWLASAGDDLTARIWSVAKETTEAILTGHTKNLTSVAFSPDGRTLATASNDASVRLWDVATWRARATLPDAGNSLAVKFAPDGCLLASVNEEGSVKLWDPASGNLLRTIRGESDQLRCVAFTPDGRNVVAAGWGQVVRVWDIATGQELLSLEGHQAQINAVAFSADGSILASCDHQGKVKLWRADWPGLAIAP